MTTWFQSPTLLFVHPLHKVCACVHQLLGSAGTAELLLSEFPIDSPCHGKLSHRLAKSGQAASEVALFLTQL